MDGAGLGADDEGWFLPGLAAEPCGEIVSQHHSKEGHEWGVSFTKTLKATQAWITETLSTGATSNNVSQARKHCSEG